MIKKRFEGEYVHYIGKGDKNLIDSKCGKWMYFFNWDNMSKVPALCERAVEEGITPHVKHTMLEYIDMDNHGLCCFYANADDTDAHKRIIQFFLDNGLIPRISSGRLKNISFKLDSQTRNNEYGDDFTARIRLDDFLDLYTGEWKEK